MTITVEQLQSALEMYAPAGVELPRDSATNGTDTGTLARWAQNAAGEINRRRQKTTIKQTVITCTDDVQDYDLPADCRSVKRLITPKSAGHEIDLMDSQYVPTWMASGAGGRLPSGQSVSPAVDAVQRRQLARGRREYDYRVIAGRIRFLFEVDAGDKITVEYEVVDRSLASVPDDLFELVLTYMRYMTLDWFIGRYAAPAALDRDGQSEVDASVLMRKQRELKAAWASGLECLGPEASNT